MTKRSLIVIGAFLCSLAVSQAARREAIGTPLVTQPAPHWIQVLKSDATFQQKSEACRQLAVNGTEAALPALIPLLADAQLSHMARYALETMPGNAVDKALRDQLPKLSGRLQAGVVASLGVRRDAKAIDALAGLLGSSDAQVAHAAARALGDIGTPDAAQALLKVWPVAEPRLRLAVCEGRLRCADRLAKDKKNKDALRIYDELWRAKDLPGQVRYGAICGAILTSSGKEGLALLKSTLMESDPVLFSGAIQAALALRDVEKSGVLDQVLPQLAGDRQIVLMQAIGARQVAAAVAPLSKIATAATQPPVRIAAIQALGSIGEPAVSALSDLVRNSSSEIARPAQEALTGIPGAQADMAVTALAKAPDAAYKLAGIEMIGRRRMADATPVLITLLKDSDSKVRVAALQRAGDLGRPADVAALLNSLLATTDAGELETGAAALSGICNRAGKPAAAIDQIVAALGKARPEQKKALLTSLGGIGGDKALATVRTTLLNAPAETRTDAVRILADWPDAGAAPELIKLMENSTSRVERVLAFRGYTRIAQNAVQSPDEKLAMFKRAAEVAKSPEEKRLVLGGLSEVHSLGALQLTAQYLTEPDLAEDAGGAAVRIASRLDAAQRAEIIPVLQSVITTVKGEETIQKARQRLKQLQSGKGT